MSQNHHQIFDNDRLPMERKGERERDGEEKKTIQSNKEQIKKKKKIMRQLVIVDWKTKRL